MKIMKFRIYESEIVTDGKNKKTHRVYFGDVPRFVKESKNWKLIYCESRESSHPPKDAGKMFLNQTGLKPDYFDQSAGANQFCVGFSNLERLFVTGFLKEFLMANSEDAGSDDPQICYSPGDGGMSLNKINALSLHK